MTSFNTRRLMRLFSITILIALLSACGGASAKKEPMVVPDTIAPVIALNGDAHLTIFLNETYSEQGATATDNVDGSVDVSITGEVNTAFYDTYILTYSATDQAGNTASVTRTVEIILSPDTPLPKVTINGEAYITLLLHEEYLELGASAIDEQEGELSVDTLGTVDITQPGTYTITYSATNSANIRGNTERVVIVASSEAFITTWQTDYREGSEDILSTLPNQIMISTFGDGYNYRVDWGDGKFDEKVTGNITHTYDIAGTYTIQIMGAFPQLYFSHSEIIGGESAGNFYFDDATKLRTVNQWGSITWRSMHRAFAETIDLTIEAIDAPDLSLVTDMSEMFHAAYNYSTELTEWNISEWDVSNVTNMSKMFRWANMFDEDISRWDVSSVTNMSYMFYKANTFNQDIGNWNVSNVTNMKGLFSDAISFNQNIDSWDVSNVTDMSYMFLHADSFNQDIGNWDVSNVENMSLMFANADLFNQDIGRWNVSNVTDMNRMFASTKLFNQDISIWNVSNVTDMNRMFSSAIAFNQNISDWDVSKVTNMSEMFFAANSFNQDISDWNVSKVKDMSRMFSAGYWADTADENYPFNQDISQWDVSNVTNMSGMFGLARSFDQNISNWDVSNVSDMSAMFDGVTLSTENYDALLIDWSSQPLQQNVHFNGGKSKYSRNARGYRDVLINNFNWNVSDGGLTNH